MHCVPGPYNASANSSSESVSRFSPCLTRATGSAPRMTRSPILAPFLGVLISSDLFFICQPPRFRLRKSRLSSFFKNIFTFVLIWY
nr:MAG TPA: hypothetical protein [Caudoviricetes sp.]